MSERTFQIISGVVIMLVGVIVVCLFQHFKVPQATQAITIGVIILLIGLSYVFCKFLIHIQPPSFKSFMDRDLSHANAELDSAIATAKGQEINVCSTNLGVPLTAIKNQKSFREYSEKLDNGINEGTINNFCIFAVYDQISAQRALVLANKFKDSPRFQLKVLLRKEVPRPQYNIFLIEGTVGFLTFEATSGSSAISLTVRKRKHVEAVKDIFSHLWSVDETRYLKRVDGISEKMVNEIKTAYCMGSQNDAN